MGLFDFLKKQPEPPKRPIRPIARPGALPPAPEPQADNHFIVITLDSCR